MAVAGSAIASSVTYLTPVVAVIVGVLFKVVPRRHVLLAIVVGLESAPKAQARDGTIDQDNRLFTAQFRIKIQGVTVEIINGEVKNGVAGIVASAHVEQLTIVNDVVYLCRVIWTRVFSKAAVLGS